MCLEAVCVQSESWRIDSRCRRLTAYDGYHITAQTCRHVSKHLLRAVHGGCDTQSPGCELAKGRMLSSIIVIVVTQYPPAARGIRHAPGRQKSPPAFRLALGRRTVLRGSRERDLRMANYQIARLPRRSSDPPTSCTTRSHVPPCHPQTTSRHCRWQSSSTRCCVPS